VGFKLNMRTAAAVLVSAAALAALAASGDTSSDGRGSNSGSAPPQSDAAKSSGAHYTVSQQNAINAAKAYLSTAAFSKKGLIEQLSSSAGDNYTEEQAQYAAKKVGLC